MHSGDRSEYNAYLTGCSLAVTLTFDLFPSKSNEFISVASCTDDVNFVKFAKAVYKISR